MHQKSIIAQMRTLHHAEEFIRRGARIPIVRAQFPTISEVPIRDIYASVWGRPGTRGLTPDSVLSMIKHQNEVLLANIFFSIYHSVGGDEIFETLDEEVFLRAYDQFMLMMPEETECLEKFDFVKMWYVARDIRSRIIDTKLCKTCGNEHLYSLMASAWIKCPYCRSARKGTGRVRRKLTEPIRRYVKKS